MTTRGCACVFVLHLQHSVTTRAEEKKRKNLKLIVKPGWLGDMAVLAEIKNVFV